jgi:uncharacterized protein (TIGR02246 family)
VKGSAADDTVSGIMAKWSAAFTKLDADELASLYSNNALFFGSNPALYRGRDGVKAYFNALPRWESPAVQFSDVVIAPVGSDVINVAAAALFSSRDEVLNLSVKLTWVIAREDGGWKIVSHHVSSRVALI